MQPKNNDLSYLLINNIMGGKQCSFNIKQVSEAKEELILVTYKKQSFA